MKNKIAIILILICVEIFSQGITKSAEGESTVLFRGASITVDITEAELNLGFNNLQNSLGEDNFLIFGGSVKGENKTGISSIFNKGDFVPSSSLNAFIGYSSSNNIPEAYKKKYSNLLESYNQLLMNSNVLIEKRFNEILIQVLEKKSNKTYQKLNGILEKSETFGGYIESLKSLDIANEEDQKKVNKVIEISEIFYGQQIVKFKLLKKELKEIELKISQKNYKQLSLFAFGGINSSKFKHYTAINLDTLSESFKDINFRGGNFGVGVNFQYKMWMFGATYSYSKSNNFSLLTKKEFNLKTSYSQLNEEATLIQEKKITAYSGDYSTVEINELNIDVIYRAALDSKAENHILINPYLKSQLFSRKKEALPNSLNLGCGFHFFNNTGKFLAGFYIELPDLENNYEKAKPLEDQNLRNPINRLSIGIVTKISLKSVLDVF